MQKFKIKHLSRGAFFIPKNTLFRTLRALNVSGGERISKWKKTQDEIGADLDFDEWVKGLQETEDGKVVYRSKQSNKQRNTKQVFSSKQEKRMM